MGQHSAIIGSGISGLGCGGAFDPETSRYDGNLVIYDTPGIPGTPTVDGLTRPKPMVGTVPPQLRCR